MPIDIEGYLNARIGEGDAYQNDWVLLQNLYAKKLWHQLTLHLELLMKKPGFKECINLVQLYENFISDFKHRINPLSLVEICLPISEEMVKDDPQKAANFLLGIKDKVSTSKEAQILCSTAVGIIKLDVEKDHTAARELIESTGSQLEELDGITPVHARFYQFSSKYHRVMGNHASYYREALRYLGCVKLDEMPMVERRQWAFSIGLAALLGEDIYNFGELLMHDVLNSLRDTPDSWLIDILYAFNRGSIDALDTLRPQWSKQADLLASELDLRRKVTLLGLMEMAFRRPANQRTFQFREIAQATNLPDDEVEMLVMRALSKGLIKGRIDQVRQQVILTWVQPRVLDLEQISTMQSRLTTWSSSVNTMRSLVEVRAKEILS